jgi:hypothetical protein
MTTYKGWRNDNFSVPNNIYVGGSLFSSILDVPYQQVKIVAKSGAPYSTITAAQTAITDNSSSKIYTVLVFPGEYDEALTLKDYVNIIAIDQFNTYILRQVTDNGVPVHCNLKINIDNRQIDGTHGLYLAAASVIHIEGNVKGSENSPASGGNGICNYSNGIITILNGNVFGGYGKWGGGNGIYNYSNGIITILNGDVIGGNSDASTGGHGIKNCSNGKVTILNSKIISGCDKFGYYGKGIFNTSTGKILIKNGLITNPGTKVTDYPILGGDIVLENCTIFGNHANVFAINAGEPKTVKCMNVWSNRDLHANITNLIPGGFNVNSEVSLP